MHLEVFDDDEWAPRVAQRWISLMRSHPRTRVCLPAGDTPRPVYEHSAAAIDLSAATVFLLDEFDLPSGSEARCDSMIQRDLLDSLNHPPGSYHRLDVDALDPDAECARFDALVADGGLDLTMLGIGTNGHLGLNEPGTAVDSPSRVVDLAPTTTSAASRYHAGANPVRGMTLGMHHIMASKSIWLLVTGSHKTAALNQMMDGPIGPDFPASYLRDHPTAVVLADRSAAAGLMSPKPGPAKGEQRP